jgi:hypothetical protein
MPTYDAALAFRLGRCCFGFPENPEPLPNPLSFGAFRYPPPQLPLRGVVP